MIPSIFHFIWFGERFPWENVLAIRSLAATSSPDRIVLHHSDPIESHPDVRALAAAVPCLELRRFDLRAMVARVGLTEPERLIATYQKLASEKRYAAMSDVVRFLALFVEGGVYLDMDTITVRDMRPLLSCEGFCGRERVLLNANQRRANSPLRFVRTTPLSALRALCASTTWGLRQWRRVENLYPAAANPAVLGLRPGHPLAREILAVIPDHAPALPIRRAAIGPDLLQDFVDGEPRTDFVVHPPEVFFPLGPYLAAHYFRDTSDVDAIRDLAIRADTRVVHWYNDNLGARRVKIDAAMVREHQGRQLFSLLAAPYAD